MITAKEASELINKNFPNRRAKQVSDYNGNYLVAAPEKGFLKSGEIDISDPYFLVEKSSGKIKMFVPTEDLYGFQNAMVNKILLKL